MLHISWQRWNRRCLVEGTIRSSPLLISKIRLRPPHHAWALPVLPACCSKAVCSASPPSAPSFATARHPHGAPAPGAGSSSPKVIYASLAWQGSQARGFCESKKLLPPAMTMSPATSTGDVRRAPTTWDRLTDLIQPQCHQFGSADIHNKCELFW